MPGTSEIEWTDATWNPVTGCSHVSPGCEYCYAERLSHRFGRTTLPWGAQHAAENVQLHPDRLDLPLRWRTPRRIFVNSMSDLFHEQVPDEFIDRVFAVMAWARKHTFQVLTKRPERMQAYLSHPTLEARLDEARCGFCPGRLCRFPGEDCGLDLAPMPLPNVWLGVSCEDQERADERIPLLLQTPAAVRFISAEPLLGPIDLVRSVNCLDWLDPASLRPGGLDWVIVGGESGGPKSRRLGCVCVGTDHAVPPCVLCVGGPAEWVRSLRDQCVYANVPFFFKQWGGPTPKSGGRVLGGRTWDEYPGMAT